MRKIGKVKYNGKSTADLGVIVSGEASFDAAAPDYTSYQIPGKNGDLMLSNSRYLNIDVTYPAFIPADFEERVQAIRNWMRSARSYARIEDNYDLLHYRMGMGKDVLPFEPTAENVGSNMSLVFDCKPQRYLYSGEEENQIGVWGPAQAASGDVVTFEDDENGAFKSIAASITPTQDLHGYDYPWPPGGGPEGAPNANICPIIGRTEATVFNNGYSYPVSWQTEVGEVYGGTVDVVSGLLTVTHVCERITSEWNISKSTLQNADIYNIKKTSSSTTALCFDDTILSHYQFYNRENVNVVGKAWLGTSQQQIRIGYAEYGQSTIEDFRKFLDDNNVQICYQLSVPVTYQLSGQHIKTLLGLNNVWADSGTVTAEWGEDPFGLYNPTLFDALPLIKVKNPQNGCAVTVNGTTMTCSRRYTGTVIIDCELMNVYSGATNLNADWSKDFPVLSPGENSVTFSGADAVTIIPRWWEL